MEYQNKISQNILWNFGKQKFLTIENFRLALKNYNEEIRGEFFSEDLDLPILKANKVAIQYEYWDQSIEDIVEPDFLLNADNGQFFTTAELLFKIHNQVHEKLKDDDHQFFEGLELWTGENPNYPDTPLYFLQQGS
ncbi:hypothetical protein EG346_20720 [Chryseobacterium carnipullorum]|uniref:Uncharacterized protein n=1 Tax=Chryseobacterium carnipullorum TaxID=1124835 RepID=A0A1M7DLJ0_CHRCU|nr:hypothetical protein [Chryseobacterium carnipullorum]AZA50454.1 hypothetical protein EG346_20720 [Chryseobacterium carnipullorum]AZA65324.1 hypothetical protein EG345_11790 [Chryseobacterium carnipullorum]SHL80350.1 hypothetical protein SAMN05444360_104239 [Chryseobacterium carnipullorum]